MNTQHQQKEKRFETSQREGEGKRERLM